jgi:hypothetical protein
MTGTLRVAGFYSPDYHLNSGKTWTVEGSRSCKPCITGMFTPSVSATIGHKRNEASGTSAARYLFSYGAGKDSCNYWHAGLTLGFLDHWSVDVRYWSTDLPSGFCNGTTFQCDERVVGTLEFS